jgi:hypothetical protein
MKKIAVILLAFLYLAISSGLMLEVHYCMGKVAAAQISFSHNNHHNNACSKCGMKAGNNNCCKDVVKFMKLQDAHKLFSFHHITKAPVIIAQPLQWPVMQLVALSSPQNLLVTHSPPYGALPCRNILFCVFKI